MELKVITNENFGEEKNPKLEVFKTFLGIFVTIGAGCVVGNAVKFTTPSGLSSFKKLGVAIGSIALTNFIGGKMGDYAEDQVDSFVKILEKVNFTIVKEEKEGEEIDE